MNINIAFCYCGKCDAFHNKLCIGGTCKCYEKEKNFNQIIEEEL